ncbi:hypothetical protein BA895_13150 [Humibacillus sp. DSM 29435]|uniref:hypothetical protein n=1 Tax=Humibacillus sp. DSM 29435 TaxID=1869167 RepID=UPI0008733CCF|nr:hypothetical protein [Humibacillus sp. DSM 29435]OFE18071.1 hypothetical protein BA895_13150 [Humibacillus sp. DSM 29435]
MVSANPDSRLRFHPWHRPILRCAGEVQFGLLPEGPIVAGLTEAEVALLARLDGSRSLRTCFVEAAATGVKALRWRELVDLLVELGLVESLPEHVGWSGSAQGPALGSALESVSASTRRPAFPGAGGSARLGRAGPPSLTAPTGPVVVDGSGPLAEQLVTLLSRDLPARSVSTTSAVMGRSVASTGAVSSVVTVDQVNATPSLVVLVGAPALDPRSGDRWLASGTTHLPVSAAGRRTTIGPLVEGPAGPCLWCLDLHRADRDDAWPTVMAQLCPDDATRLTASVRGAGPLHGVDLLTAAELHLTAGSVAVFVQSVLAGHRPPPGISIDICLPWPRTDHRRWAVHPRCRLHDGVEPYEDRQGSDGQRVDDGDAVA